MSQVFISYASEDRPWVERFAASLEAQGWSVWWDRQIPTGHTYDDVIWQALQAAPCVVVVWSQHSIASEWVKEEASEAKKRNRLLPVRIDEARPPFGFSRRQTQSLVDWQDGVAHPGYAQLLKDIAQLLNAPPPVVDAGMSPVAAKLRSWRWWIVSTPLLLILLLLVMFWRVPTHVEIEVTVNRVQFTVGQLPGRWTSLVGSLNVDSLLFRQFGRATFRPQSVEVADPAQYDFDRDRYPASAWRPARFTGEALELLPLVGTGDPSLTVRGAPNQEALDDKPPPVGGRLDSLVVSSGAEVVVERAARDRSSLTIDLHLPDLQSTAPHASVALTGPSLVTTSQVSVQGITLPDGTEDKSLTLRVIPSNQVTTVIVEGVGTSLAMTIRVGKETADVVLGDQPFPVTALDLSKQGEAGARVSALSDQAVGSIRYPEFSALPAVQVAAPDYLSVGELDRFVMKRMDWSREGSGFTLVLEGVAGHLATQSGAFTRDLRLTQFDRLWHHQRLAALLAILGWVVPIVIKVYTSIKDIRSR